MKEFVIDFIAKHDIKEKSLPPQYYPYTNFSIFDRSYFSESYLFRDFASSVRKTGCIDINRWGDLPLLAYYLWLSNDRYTLLLDLVYDHKSHDALVNIGDNLIWQKSWIDILIPKKCPYQLIRIGGNRDGGYLIPDDLEGIAKCFSPGVNNYKFFEDELSTAYGIKCFMCDYSSDEHKFATPLVEGMQFFQKKWLDVDGAPNAISLSEWIISSGTDDDEDLMLQIDIEGAEYRNLLSADLCLLNRFRIIIIELHSLSSLRSDDTDSNPIVRVLRKLDETHVCVHVHPNNCGGDSFIDATTGVNVPNVVEVTFLRRDRFGIDPKLWITPQLPHPLDIDTNSNSFPPMHLNQNWTLGPITDTSLMKILSNEQNFRAVLQSKSDLHYISWMNALEAIRRLYDIILTNSACNNSKLEQIELAAGKKYTLTSSLANLPLTGYIAPKEPFFFHTGIGRNQAITIDFGKVHQFFELMIKNRSDVCLDRARCLWVSVHNHSSWNNSRSLPVCISEQFLSMPNAISYTPLLGMTGRYISIFSEAETAIHFSEIAVLGSPYIDPDHEAARTHCLQLRTDLHRFGRKVSSQNDEDGILEAIFDDIGLTNKRAVEFGIGPNGHAKDYSLGLEGNTVLLMANGWDVLLLDCGSHPPEYDIKKELITPSNINSILKKYGYQELDLISIDVDGLDYWIWNALEVRPRVVVIEYNASFPDAETAVTIAHNENHMWDFTNYFGASHGAFVALAQEKGYTLVYANGINLFFVRQSEFSNYNEFDHKKLFKYLPIHAPDPLNRHWIDVSSKAPKLL